MGAIISKFRKEKTTYEILENLDEKIKDIEAYTISTQARQKRFVGSFLVISIVLYILASLIFYFVFFPPTWNERIVHSLPLLICPMIIMFIKKGLAWHFERKVIGNTNELKQLRAEKKKILEKVMDKETYKVAVDILNKFGDKAMKAQVQPLNNLTPARAPMPMPITPKMAAQSRPQSAPQSAPVPQFTPGQMRHMPTTPIGFNLNRRSLSPAAQATLQRQQSGGLIQRPIGMVPQTMQTMPYRRTPFPIINHNQRGVLEKMVDYLVGDGPNSRFAMICKDCLMHNGMALKEEYEYVAFRCAFCGSLNPAKKLRPLAPKLPFELAQLDKMSEVRRSTSSIADSEASAPEENRSGETEAASDQDDTEENTQVQEDAALSDNEPEEASDDNTEVASENIITPEEEELVKQQQEVTKNDDSEQPHLQTEERVD